MGICELRGWQEGKLEVKGRSRVPMDGGAFHKEPMAPEFSSGATWKSLERDEVESFPSFTHVDMHSCHFSALAPRILLETMSSN